MIRRTQSLLFWIFLATTSILLFPVAVVVWAVTLPFDRRKVVPIADVASALGASKVLSVPIPHDCVDGFHGAFWRRPEAYLDARVRSGISSFAAMPPDAREEGLRRLAADLQNGAWEDRHRKLLEIEELDLGYRLIVADPG